MLGSTHPCISSSDTCLSWISASPQVTVPKMLRNFLSQKKSISVWGCITQSFFFTLSGGTEACLLSAMAYDRYAAICHPPLYTVVINRPLCTGIVSIAWAVGFSISLMNSLFVHKLHFCASNIIRHFSCELPPLFPLSCTDPPANEILLAVSCTSLGLLTLPPILFSYSRIISAILSICSSEGQGKAFSTCSSHLTAGTRPLADLCGEPKVNVNSLLTGSAWNTNGKWTPSYP